jgi:hypothetical protein
MEQHGDTHVQVGSEMQAAAMTQVVTFGQRPISIGT